MKNFTTQTKEKELFYVHFNKLQHFKQYSGKKICPPLPQISKNLRYEKNNYVAMFVRRFFAYDHKKNLPAMIALQCYHIE